MSLTSLSSHILLWLVTANNKPCASNHNRSFSHHVFQESIGQCWYQSYWRCSDILKQTHHIISRCLHWTQLQLLAPGSSAACAGSPTSAQHRQGSRFSLLRALQQRSSTLALAIVSIKCLIPVKYSSATKICAPQAPSSHVGGNIYLALWECELQIRPYLFGQSKTFRKKCTGAWEL